MAKTTRTRFEVAYAVESERWALVDNRGRTVLAFMATPSGIEMKIGGHRFELLIEESRYHGAEVRIVSCGGQRPPQRMLRGTWR